MSLARTVTRLLTGMTEGRVRATAPRERQALCIQLQRVYRLIEGDRIVEEARRAAAPRPGVGSGGRAAFFAELADGRGRE
jgi:hypothetical protein